MEALPPLPAPLAAPNQRQPAQLLPLMQLTAPHPNHFHVFSERAGMTQPEQTNDSGAQQSAEAQLPKKTIRKFWIGALALCAALVLIATLVFSGSNSPEGGNSSYVSPEDVATAFFTAVSKGEVDKALALVHFPEGTSPAQKEAVLGALREGKKEFDDKGGLARVEVVTDLETVTNEIFHDNPGHARVKLRMHFKNGQQEQGEFELIWVKEKWKLRVLRM